jgi:glycosyltransferase involved in cell wall biosynthesis
MAQGRELLGDRLIHLGHVTDVKGFINAIDVFVGTSQAEGCSNSVLQALACGTPVVSYPSTSVDEQVLPDGGAIVPQDRADLLAEELRRWVTDPERREAGRAGARTRAESSFDIRRIADQMWDEYQQLHRNGTH